MTLRLFVSFFIALQKPKSGLPSKVQEDQNIEEKLTQTLLAILESLNL